MDPTNMVVDLPLALQSLKPTHGCDYKLGFQQRASGAAHVNPVLSNLTFRFTSNVVEFTRTSG